MHEKDIQGPEQKQMTGQLRIPENLARERHIAQFWSKNMSDAGVAIKKTRQEKHVTEVKPKKDLTQLYESMAHIGNASTVREVSQKATQAYAMGAKGAPHQQAVQEMVRKRKAELRQKRSRPTRVSELYQSMGMKLGDNYGF